MHLWLSLQSYYLFFSHYSIFVENFSFVGFIVVNSTAAESVKDLLHPYQEFYRPLTSPMLLSPHPV
jgi:hypothetical protein